MGTALAALMCGGTVSHQDPFTLAKWVANTRSLTSTPWQDLLYSDPFNTFYRSPFNAAPTGSQVVLRLVGPSSLQRATIQLSSVNGNVNDTATITMTRLPKKTFNSAPNVGQLTNRSVWQGVIPSKDLAKPGVLNYDFSAVDGGSAVYYANDTAGYGGPGAVYPNPFALVYYQITVYANTFTTPSWLRHGIIYEIMPDRFYDGDPALNENPKTQSAISINAEGQQVLVPIQFHKDWYSTPYDPNVVANPDSKNYEQELTLRGNGTWNTDFFGGDLQGIIDKLSYLQKLGVNTLYLTPIFKSESNHKYDTGNYKEIDPGFGKLKTYITLIRDARNRGMHVILDGAFEDTSSDSLYFNMFDNYKSVGAWQEHLDPKDHSPYYNWFLWEPGQDPPYQDWGGVANMVLTNTKSKGFQNYIYGAFDPKDPTDPLTNSVADYWISLGASGWRLDSADNSNFSVAWWTSFRKAVLRADPQAAIIGEDWNNPTNDNGVDWLTGTTWDSTMNYPFRNAVISFFRGTYYDGNVQNYAIDAQTLGNTLMQMMQEYPKPAMYAEMNLLGSQDTERILTILDGAPDANNLTAYEQATWKPTAAQTKEGIAKLKEVTAFQYGFVGVPDIYYGDEAGMTGYTDPLNRATYPWGRVNQNLIDYYRLLGKIRNSNPVLQSGNYVQLYAKGNVFVYARTIREGKGVFGRPLSDATAIIAVNNGPSQTVSIPVSTLLPNGTVVYDEIMGNKTYQVKNELLQLHLPQYGAAMLFTKRSHN